jgi:hypothetical protein
VPIAGEASTHADDLKFLESYRLKEKEIVSTVGRL